ncbi:hypothetical protein G7085_11405 [Tessaracoccus sp. HDW20]|nr:hypothetical protein [Tessaracoccus coleopterorum]NHB85014.1 hypothetical protein [Tessaracoccus coleopterorum]
MGKGKDCWIAANATSSAASNGSTTSTWTNSQIAAAGRAMLALPSTTLRAPAAASRFTSEASIAADCGW